RRSSSWLPWRSRTHVEAAQEGSEVDLLVREHQVLRAIFRKVRERREDETPELVVHRAEKARLVLLLLGTRLEARAKVLALLARRAAHGHDEAGGLDRGRVFGVRCRHELPLLEDDLLLQLDREVEGRGRVCAGARGGGLRVPARDLVPAIERRAGS